MRINLNSLKFKISVLALLILAVILIIYSGFLFSTFRYMLYQELDATLAGKVRKIESAVTSYLDVLGYDQKSFEFSVDRVIAQTGEHPHKNKIEKLERLWLGQAEPLGFRQDYVEFLDANGNVMVRSANLRAARMPAISPQEIQTVLKGRPIFKDILLGAEPLRLVLSPVVYERLGKQKNYIIIIATSRGRIIHILKERLFTKVVSIVIILVIASFLSQLFTKRVLKPLHEITETARNINYNDLSVRIKTEDVDLEMKDLVDSLNEMMSRLEKSFQYIAEFSGHVAHELKTPLAILRGETELALRIEHSPEEYRKVLEGNLEEIARMSKIIEDLLLSTKLDYQPHVFKLQDFDLTEFFTEIEESIRLLANEKNITVSMDLPAGPLPVRGDKTHLRRLFFNLINNAIKFTYPYGTIRIHVRREGAKVLASVSDTGVGIPEDNLKKVFDKFFHYDGPALNPGPGNGLGLSIAQSIAKIHSGEITVSSRVGEGSTFTVKLPVR